MRLCLRFLAVILAVCVLAGVGCNRGEGKRKPEAKQPKIGFSIADEGRDGNRTIKKTVEERARRDDLEVTWKDAKGDPQQQERDIDKLIEQGMDAVVVQFADPLVGPGIVRRLRMNKIKVVALETLPPDSPVDGFIASEHAAIGKLQARYLVENTPANGGRAVMLSGDPNDPMAQGIVEALRQALDGKGWMLEVHDHPGSDSSRVATTVDKVLAGGTPDAFLATDSRMAVAAVEKLRVRGLLEQVLTVGVGADRTAAEALVRGDHDAEVDVMPEQLGQFAYEAALGLAREGRWQYDSQTMDGDFSVPTRFTPVRLIEADNAFLLEERHGDLTRLAGGQQGGSGGGGGSQGGAGGGGSGGGGSGGGGEGGGKEKPPSVTRLTITTQDGKTVEIDVPGEVQSIETQSMPKEQQTGQAGGQGGGGGGGEGGEGGGGSEGGAAGGAGGAAGAGA